ncbi:MAG: hypothetical protein IJV02_02160 [Candidatus Methanomethylophilaceae archaeon]|nr:hypothetical protein [Candidatus Methanomethylophilaceae archaeon]
MFENIGSRFKRVPTYTTDQMIQIISEEAPKHHIRSVYFKTDSPDGIITKKDSLEIYVVSNGQMGYLDFGTFMKHLIDTLNRNAHYYACDSKTDESELRNEGATLAYTA